MFELMLRDDDLAKAVNGMKDITNDSFFYETIVKIDNASI